MKWGVLLINIGSPTEPTPRAVRRYLGEFLMDPEVIDIPGVLRWLLVHGVILRTRPARVAHAYRQVWTPTGSPLAVTHQAFARELAALLPQAMVRAPYRYGTPSVDDSVAELAAAGVTHVLVLPMYPQYSTAATESGLRVARESLARRMPGASVKEIREFYRRPEFLEPASALLREQIAAFKPDHVILSFHGLPERQLRRLTPPPCLEDQSCCDVVSERNRDCYRAQCYATAREMFNLARWDTARASVAFQSRLGRTPWIRPYTDQLYESLPKQGVKRLLVACPSFVADCLETLEEVAIRGRDAFVAAGGRELALVPCVNVDPRWVQASARWIAQEMGQEVIG